MTQQYIDSLPDDTTIINLSYKGLTILPDLLRFKNLQYLFCSNNQLTSLPTLNDKLQILYCYHNKLTSLPDLNNRLQILDCSNNQLTSLPDLNDNLQYLDCSNNPFYALDSADKIDIMKQKIKILIHFKQLYYSLKYKKQFRKWLWELVREPKIAKKFHPSYLEDKLIDGATINEVLANWINDE